MFFTLEVKSENDAFSDDESSRGELAIMLANTARSLTLGESEGVLMDVNGNRSGEWNYESRTEEEIEAENSQVSAESAAAVSSVISMLTRSSCVAILEGISIQCYDEERVDELREAVQANVEDGTLTQDDVLSALVG